MVYLVVLLFFGGFITINIGAWQFCPVFGLMISGLSMIFFSLFFSEVRKKGDK